MTGPTIKLTIDGIPVEVEKGKTILEAAQCAGIRIPTLCHDRRLVPFGACRLCVVEEKGKSELLPSCFSPALNGMEIITTSPKIIDSRRTQLQLILLNHPMICPRCEKEGECDLQSLVYEYGLRDDVLPWDPITFPVDHATPLLQRDGNKCILCGRCVRICDEVQGVGELAFMKRGIQTLIDTDFHRPMDCEFCGQCLDTCPVGAITSNAFDYRTKAWELKETTTPCPFCGVGCLLTIGSKEGEIKRVFSQPDQGPNDGNLCARGRFGWDFSDSSERLTVPLYRNNGSFEVISWEEAIDLMVKRFEGMKAGYGPESIGAILSSRLTNEEYFLLKKLFQKAFQSDQIGFDCEREKAFAEGLSKTLGYPSSTNSIQEIRKADCILMMGMDPAQTHPIIKNEIHQAIRKNRAQLIILGSQDMSLSRNTKLSPLSHPSIPLLTKPGRELHLINGMIGAILKAGLEDRDFIMGRTEGIEALRELQEVYQRNLSEEESKKVEAAARAYALSERSMILIGPGPWSYAQSEKISIAASNLALLTGHIGKESTGILLLHEKSNVQGAMDMKMFSNGTNVNNLMQKAKEGKLKALYLIGANPFLSPKVLEQLEMLVVQDLFMTEAAQKAHLILPVCAFIEKSGTYTNLERRLQRLQPIRPPKGQSKSDFEIFQALLHRWEVLIPGETSNEIFDEISKTFPLYQSVEEGKQWPKGLRYLYEDEFPIGKARFIALVQPEPEYHPDPSHFSLIQIPLPFQSGDLSLRSENLRRVMKKPILKINPEDAQEMNIQEGETLEISMPEGNQFKIPVTLSSQLARGVLIASSARLKEGKRHCWVKVKKSKEH